MPQVDQLSSASALDAMLAAIRHAASAADPRQALSLLLAEGRPTFWGIFYPSVFFYLAFYFLRGGSGSEGLLANIRDLLWIPITQAAYRCVRLPCVRGSMRIGRGSHPTLLSTHLHTLSPLTNSLPHTLPHTLPLIHALSLSLTAAQACEPGRVRPPAGARPQLPHEGKPVGRGGNSPD
jgi:hypothetical protein